MEPIQYRSSAGPPTPIDEIARITKERDEWRRRAEEAECRDNDELRVALTGHKKLMQERDALAVQNDALRKALEAIMKTAIYAGYCSDKKYVACCGADVGDQHEPDCLARAACALDLPAAAKIAEARRKVCDAALMMTCIGQRGSDGGHAPLEGALAELRKLESEKS